MKNVLVTPLDWGLGHATRCIPIINELLKRECNVFIGGFGDSLQLLKDEFPTLGFFSLPGYSPVYPSFGSMTLKMLTQLPKFFSAIKEEHVAIEKAIKERKIDLIISDNRYGCWSSAIPSVFITHQTNILLPQSFGWLSALVRRINFSLINKFSVCWIPDYLDERSLAGKLRSLGKTNLAIPMKHVGTLSRMGNPKQKEFLYDIACVLSGPEPQRSVFEKLAVDQLSKSGLRYFLVRGIVGHQNNPDQPDNHVNFLSADALQTIIEQSECVLARSGYSTIMDLAALGKKAIFVPTPGQTEQEYLAAHLMTKGVAFAVDQKRFNIMEAWDQINFFTGFNVFHSDAQFLTDALDEFLPTGVSQKVPQHT